MNSHQNASTTPYSRGVLVERVLKQGRPRQEVAGEVGISVRSVGKWIARFNAEGPAGLCNRPSTPTACPIAPRRTVRR
jgi:transposase